MPSPDRLRLARVVLVALIGAGPIVACEGSDAVSDVGLSSADASQGRPDAIPDDSDAIVNGSDAMLDAIVDRPDAILDASSTMQDATPDTISDVMPDAITDAIPDARGAMPDAGPPDAALDPDREYRCADGLDDDGDGAADCADGDCLAADPCRGVPQTPVERVQDLFIQRCGCHTGALDEGGLRLVRPFTDTTVGRPAVLDPGRILIVPGDVEASFLYFKLLDGLPPDLGERMPPEIPYLDPDQLALVADWIAGLAPP